MTNKVLPGLSSRIVNKKESNVDSCKVFTIDQIEENFKKSIRAFDRYLKHSSNFYKNGKNKFSQDLNKVLLASLESSFDYFVHCTVKLAFNNIFLQIWCSNQFYEKYPIPMGVVNKLIANNTDSSPLINFINERTSADTYMSYDKFKDILKCISDNFLDSVVSDLYSSKYDELKELMTSIYKKRNIIAHQDGRVNVNGKRIRITIDELQNYRNQINKLVEKMIEKIKQISC